MSTDAKTITELHALYVALTGLQIRLDMQREHEWFAWMRHGFTSQDLRVIVAHLRRQIREGKRNPGCLKFRNLICNLDYFEEDLAEARAFARVPKVDAGRSAALKATGRDPEPKQRPARSASDVLAGEKAFQDFQKLKELL